MLLFYRRLAITFSRAFMIATWIGIAYNICFLVGFLFAITFICLPVRAYWMQFDSAWDKTHKFTCLDEHKYLPTSAILSAVGDFYSTLIPMLQIGALGLSRRQKVALYPLFGLGFLYVQPPSPSHPLSPH